jgi:hypothetical protein
MTKHTLGPWKARNNSAITAGDMTLARVYWSEGRSDAENTANASLIAASPDLLEACKEAMRILALWGGNDCPEDSHLFEENRALFMMQNAFEMAIAKAESKVPCQA